MRKTVWYKDGLRFHCKRCGDCCRGEPGYVWITKKEIAAMSERLGISVEDFSLRHVRRVGIRHSLRELRNGDCVLYDGGCVVYEARPRQCAVWPFWKENIASEAAWQEVLDACPGAGKGRLYTKEEIENLHTKGSDPFCCPGK